MSDIIGLEDFNYIFRTVVKKDWGYELWLHNEDKCYKLLVIYPGWECSLHFHRNKKETFTVLSGKIMIEIGAYMEDGVYICSGKKEMTVGDSISVSNLTVHRFSTVEDVAIVLESSSHHEDSDTYRITKSRCVK